MALKSRKLILIFLPMLVVAGLDLLVKKLVIANALDGDFLFLKFTMTANKGIIGGYFGEAAKPVFQIPMITVGFFLLVSHYFLQLFAPVKSILFRLSISIFFGGVFANVVDRLIRGYVVDYVTIHLFGVTTPAFNLADVFQIFGIGAMFVLQFRSGVFDESYGDRLWVSKHFQRRYSFQLVKLGASLILIFGVLSYTFVKVAFAEMALVAQVRDKLMWDYLVFFLSTAITFLLFLFLIGRALSAHVVKPILNFEHYLRNLAKGDYKVFQVEEPEFNYLEKLSDDVRDHIVELHRRISRLEAGSKKVKSAKN